MPTATPRGNNLAMKPANPGLLAKWKQSVLEDPNTKHVHLKKGKVRIKFELKTSDIEEKFVKGFGPGG